MNRRPDDTGSITPFLLMTALALFAVVALVTEGGRAMSARLAAEAEAEQAARAGAAVFSAFTLRSAGGASAEQAAVEAAEEVMAAAGHPGRAWTSGTSVTARVDRFEVLTPLLAFVGVDRVAVSAQASAEAVAG